MPRRAYDDPTYKRNRLRVLERDGYTCQYCQRPARTVDHLVPVARGGGNEVDNLVACCSECNSRRGQATQTQDIRARLKKRNAALTDAGTALDVAEPSGFLGTTHSPRAALVVVSANQPESAGMGRDLPRLETTVPELDDSDADAIADWAKTFLGVTLMPWQRRVLHGMTVKTAAGELQHRASLVSTARQQGKTVALTALVGWWLTVRPITHGPQTVLTTAHRLDVAVELFHRLADILETQFAARVLRAYGRNQVEMPDGSRWLVKAATGSVGHGLSCDLIVVDEVWSVSAEAIDQGLLPTMRARPEPLLSMWSTAGTEASDVMLRYREQGIQLIDAGRPGDLYFAEWSPALDLDPMSPEAWAYANPALGRTLKLKTLEAESRSPDRAAFLRAAVNLWVATERGWLTPGLWPELKLDGVDIPAGGVVALEQSLDESRYFGLRAVALGDGRTAVTVEFQAGTITEWIAAVERLAADPKIRFAVTPTLDIHYPAHLMGRRTSVGYRELLAWTPTVRQMLEQKRVVHTGEQLLAEHVQRAVAVKTQNSVALSSQRSPGPIELARCMVWAVALTSKTVVSGKPMIVVAGG